MQNRRAFFYGLFTLAGGLALCLAGMFVLGSKNGLPPRGPEDVHDGTHYPVSADTFEPIFFYALGVCGIAFGIAAVVWSLGPATTNDPRKK